MKLSELIEKTGFEFSSDDVRGDCEVTGCYIGDLLSLAMAKVEEGNVWITIQTNVNIVAVASLKEAACVVIADGYQPDDMAKAKAEAEDIIILTTELSAYDAAKALASLGV